MTKQEILDLYDLDEKRVYPKNRYRWGLGGVIALLVLFFQLSGTLTWPLDAQGAIWQDLLAKPVSSEQEQPVSYNVGYSREQGIVVQKLEETPIKVQVDGTSVIARALLPRLDDILQEVGIKLGEWDRAEARIVSSSGGIPEVEVIRVATSVATEKKSIPFKIKRVTDKQLPKGTTKIKQAGCEGIRVDKYEVTTENGEVVQRKELGSEVIKEPVNQVVAFGGKEINKKVQVASRGVELPGSRVLEMTATAYTHTGNATASGVMPYVGGVAVDPKVIPLGTKLFVEGYGYAKAVDTGGLIKGNRIDIFLETAKECFSWGRRKVKVHILE